MSRPAFIINFKNYSKVLGAGALNLAASAERAGSGLDLEIVLAPPVPALALVASAVKLPVFSQKVDDAEEGKSTGAIIPEALKNWRCAGSIINHSEARVSLDGIPSIVARMKRLGLASCVCAESQEEVIQVVAAGPEQVAIEPKDLIGTGIAVSKARPSLISDCVEAARRSGFRGRVLCGAGIVSAEDVKAAMGLGADGVLVASAVVMSNDWDAKIRELANALVR